MYLFYLHGLTKFHMKMNFHVSKVIKSTQFVTLSQMCHIWENMNNYSGGSRISRRGRGPRGGASTPEAVTFRAGHAPLGSANELKGCIKRGF